MKKKNKGMTLLEVMIALVISALTSSAVMNVIYNTMHGLSGMEESYFGQMVADNVLSQIKLNKIWPSNSWVNDKQELAGRTWYYRYRGQNTQDVNFRSLEVEVFKLECLVVVILQVVLVVVAVNSQPLCAFVGIGLGEENIC